MSPERLAQLVLQNVDVAILTTDLDGVITSWNIASERTMGWSAVEAIGWGCLHDLHARGHSG